MNGRAGFSKVAFVTSMAGEPWGGSEELWSLTALRLRSMGHSVAASVFEWPSRPSQVTELITAGVGVAFRTRTKNLAGRLLERSIQRISPSPLDHESMAWLQKSAPDLLVLSQGGPWEGISWMQACRDLGIRYCAIIHSNSEAWWPADERRDGILTGYGSAERVFFVSNANKRLMEMECGVRFENGEVVINPWKVDAVDALPWPGDDGTTRIACVGRVDPKAKGQDLLLRVMAMSKWRERSLHVNIYGRGPCERSLVALQEMLDVRNVTFAGHVSDVRRIWGENHALILPSRYEGLPLVIVEAMLCGRPVITTDVAGNVEYLEEGVTGFIAGAPTSALLDDALERAWAKRLEWEAMGTAARQHMHTALPADPVGIFSRRLLELVP